MASKDNSDVTREDSQMNITMEAGSEKNTMRRCLNSTVMDQQDHASNFGAAENDLSLSPILNVASSYSLTSNQLWRFRRTDSSPLSSRDSRLSSSDVSHLESHNHSSLIEKEPSTENSVCAEGRKLMQIEEEKELNEDSAEEMASTSNPSKSEDGTSKSQFVSNPFEDGLLESLSTTAFSPNFLSTASTQRSADSSHGLAESAPFRWSIEQLAALFPADIDDTQDESVHPRDPVFEAKAHSAIERFWSTQKYVVPSPSINVGSSSRQRPAYEGSPPWTQSNGSAMETPPTGRMRLWSNGKLGESPLVRGGARRVAAARRTKSTQTLLTFPPNLDLAGLLGGRFQYDELEDAAEEAAFEANLSLHTLRRELFADGNDVSSSNQLDNSEVHFSSSDDEGDHSARASADCSFSYKGNFLMEEIESPRGKNLTRLRLSPDMSPIKDDTT